MKDETPGLQRFLDAQEGVYPGALQEIRRGAKRGHWMWFIFPQLAGLGRSPTARQFAIASLDEAGDYLAHPVLGRRLRECVEALQDTDGRTAVEVFGDVDAMKLQSSLTLFALAGGGAIFEAALARWFGGPDPRTMEMLAGQPGAPGPSALPRGSSER